MLNQNNLELLAQLESEPWKQKVSAAKKLGLSNSSEVVPKLWGFLDHKDIEVRQASALALRSIGCDESVPYLIDAFYSPRNEANRSIFVYALEKLDCSGYFRQIFSMLFSSKIHIRQSAMTIYMNQGFYVDNEDILFAQQWLNDRGDLATEYEIFEQILKRLSEFEK